MLHELRTPVQAVIGHASLFDYAQGPQAARERLVRIHQGGIWLRLIVEDLALREGDPATAALAWTQALAMAEELFGADTIATARWRVPMAEALLAAGDLAAARDAYRRASPVLRAQMLPGSDLLQRLDRLQEALHAS